MELRDYFKIIGKYFKIFIAIVILGGAAALILTKTQPKTFTASTTFTVNKNSVLKQSEIQYYLFDNYYNVQSAGLFSQIVTTWFESPALVKEIYQKAGIDVPNVSQKKLSKTFKAVRQEPATINVTISGTDKEQLDKLINGAATVLQEKTNELGNNNDSFYEIAFFTPIVTQNTPSLLLNTIIGLIAGVLFGAIIALAIDYFKGEKSV
ncbi:hypothetical protein A2V71_04540 [Candidatus Berkelbacteria bacterium RBG_13_40_8]|uniref:Polysaccharide chain length determinant N-terminal domain-containing protein n=1 Tax=Candidatus Berkelbacteria bacterium RBG_13_40_8 TaxID=1797467 RepID=A0A1F5DMU4_9BACT|nr:MAG: hypothetical protein A2V71_04540 [Candidatus Berkelbacteria bacterium RBG_13_40_8]